MEKEEALKGCRVGKDMKALKTINNNFVINNLIVSPEGKILREVSSNNEMEFLKGVCEEVELPDGFNLEEIERYSTFDNFMQEQVAELSRARKKFFVELLDSPVRNYRIPNDLGEYEIEDGINLDYLYNDFESEVVDTLYIKKGELLDRGIILPDDLIEFNPLFIIVKARNVYEGEDLIHKKSIIKCTNLSLIIDRINKNRREIGKKVEKELSY